MAIFPIPPLFKDRRQAGIRLGQRLRGHRSSKPIVLGLARGGVPVAYEVARELDAPLDVLISRKIGAPGYHEYGIGALCEDGTVWLNSAACRETGASESYLNQTISAEKKEIRRRTGRYREGLPLIAVRGRHVIVVDDGLATGATARASVRALRKMGAAHVTLAVPVAALDTANSLSKEADEVIALQTPEYFQAVGEWYEDFSQTGDDEVTALLRKAKEARTPPSETQLEIEGDGVRLDADLMVPPLARGLVIFAHGSGSSRLSPRNRMVAQTLNEAGFATLLFDLLEPSEAENRENVFDIPLLADRLLLAYASMKQRPETFELPISFFGASTGAAAALWAASTLGNDISCVVSRGGRPDLAMEKLADVTAPTLLLVGGEDREVIALNRRAQSRLPSSKLVIIVGATHLFEEPGTLENAANAAVEWVTAHLPEPRVLSRAA